MVTFFSWRKICRMSGRSSKRIILCARSLIAKSYPKNRYDPLYDYYYTDFSGESFLVNLEELLENSFRYTNKEIAEYIGLASLRSFANYKLTKDASLDLFHCNMTEDTINKNRLLRVVNGRVHFYYEEDTNRRNAIWQRHS